MNSKSKPNQTTFFIGLKEQNWINQKSIQFEFKNMDNLPSNYSYIQFQTITIQSRRNNHKY